MARSKTENNSYVGVIVAGGDSNPDPQKMGRVKVAVPQLHSPGFDVDKLPWIQLGSVSNDTGPLSFDRPPQEGTMVRIRYPAGSKSSGRGIIEYVYNAKRDPQPLPGNSQLWNQGWFKQALDIKPDVNGPPDIEQLTEDNRTGVEKVTSEIVDKTITSIGERIGIPSSLADSVFVKPFEPVKQIATAVQHASSVMNSSIANALPGIPMQFSQLLNNIPTNLPANIKSGIESIGKIITNESLLSGTNFLQLGNRVNPNTFANKAKEVLSTVTTFGELSDALKKITTDPDIKDIASLGETVISLLGPFGEMIQKIDSEGNISIEDNDIIQDLISAFLSLIGGIPTAIGNLLEKSEILTDTYNRLPIDVQEEFLNKVAKQIPEKLGGILLKSRGHLG